MCAPGRDSPVRGRSRHVGARHQLPGPRGGQPLRRRHELLPEHRRGEPGSDGDGERASRRRPSARSSRVARGGTPDGAQERDQRRLRGRRRAGRRPRHVPGGEHDLHRPGGVRPVDHAVRGLVPAAGRRRDHVGTPGRRPQQPVRREAGLPRGPHGQPARDGPPPRQLGARGGRARVLAAAGRHGEPRRRVRPHGSHPEHVRCSVSPCCGRPRDPRAQRPARAWHRARARVRRRLRRPGLLVGAAVDVGDPAGRAPGRQPAAAAAGRDGTARRRRGRRPGFPLASGSTRGSPCFTASARRSTATGLSST